MLTHAHAALPGMGVDAGRAARGIACCLRFSVVVGISSNQRRNMCLGYDGIGRSMKFEVGDTEIIPWQFDMF